MLMFAWKILLLFIKPFALTVDSYKGVAIVSCSYSFKFLDIPLAKVGKAVFD